MRNRLIMLLVPALLAAVVWGVFPSRAEDNSLKFKLKPGAGSKICFNCHAAFQETMKKPFVHTPLKKGDCAGCHNPHTSRHGKLLDADRSRICFRCHPDLTPSGSRSVHKVVAAGDCMKCHDPHAAANKFQLRQSGNDLCFDCHKELKQQLEKIKFKHSPVTKGCLTCHLPHASATAPFLLRADISSLCTGCHKTDRPLFAKQHMNYPVAGSRCTGCHDPHGSNREGLLYNGVHKPVAGRMCNQCHEEANSAKPLALKKRGAELCRGCHSVKMNEILGKNRLHWPLLGKDECLNCHNPHASKDAGLLKTDMKSLCGSCHEEAVRRQDRSASKHEPVDKGQCTACHNPHSSDYLFLAKAPTDAEWCGSCHDWQKHSTHPLGDKAIDPRNRNLTVQCLSCHRAHGTEYKHLIPFVTVSDLCTQCHQQYKR